MRENFSELSMGKRVLWIIGGAFFGAAMALLFGFIVKILWNWLMTDLFNLPVITYWQAWGIAFLSHILFKGGVPDHGGHDKSNRKERSSSSRIAGLGHESCNWNDDSDGSHWDEFKEVLKREFRKEFEKEFEKKRDSETIDPKS